MGRKIKYIAVILISMLLVWQQAQVSYADDAQEPEEVENPEETEIPIKIYEVVISSEDGKNGYYRTKPEVMIIHQDESVVTKYCLTNADSLVNKEAALEGELENVGEKAVIPKEKFAEGKNRLHIWMEDVEGEKIEDSECEKEFLVDTCPPEIKESVPAGFDTWYKKGVVLSSCGEDGVSGMAKITCFAAGKMIGEINGKEGDFYIDTASRYGKTVEVLIKAEDRAGNQSERVQSVYIDNQAPHIRIHGAQDYTITSKPITVAYEIEEDNILQEFFAQTQWENIRGKRTMIPVEEWKETNIGKQAEQKFTEDGIYKIQLQAADKAGYTDESSRQIIIDKANPLIRHVDELDQSYMKKFSWNYPQEEIIQDFTTYTYEIRLDGQLYHMGEAVTDEGKHYLEVRVKDAAGNESVAKAEFLIDHTEPEIHFTDIEEGGEYEEEITFRIAVAGQDDRITRISINGKSQKLNSQSKAYQYTLKECDTYEVEVTARDKTGNMSKESVMFKIIPKKTLVQKIAKPFQNTFSKKRNINVGNMEKQEEKHIGMWIIMAACLAAGVFAGGYRMYKKRNK